MGQMTEAERKGRMLRLAAAIAVGLVAALLPLLRADAVPTASRIEGADRYATAAAVSANAFAPGVDVAYVVTGTNFPDALAGAPAAAHEGGPVLLTQADA